MEIDWKKKYEEALGIASRIKDDDTVATPQEVAEQIFPELAESEDEKMRKTIVNLVLKAQQQEETSYNDWAYDAMLAWLEKIKELNARKEGQQ